MADQDVERQLVVFTLADEAYGVSIETVREIIRMQKITVVPAAPEYVEGVINLRGQVVPIVDLRCRLGLPVGETTIDTRIVVVEITGESIGVIVDAVNEVQRISGAAVSSTSALVTTAESYYIEGIVQLDEQLLILLDLERALSAGVSELLEAGGLAPSERSPSSRRCSMSGSAACIGARAGSVSTEAHAADSYPAYHLWAVRSSMGRLRRRAAIARSRG